ncbi:hypothetical protein EGJ28_10585 [Stutzerimonas xanthomarina]|uniref:Uncharacterized protein n=1 Tax=Stutzerimonas xanthomarina TaxID=271420 RepID=A0A427E5P5_9GAMM|nr:hypothetical protein [Stutzerimonas xanthomarina]RRV11845.1 hypothetical protein EGJ28_10585 [Stutzerimonas xanthomarina]
MIRFVAACLLAVFTVSLFAFSIVLIGSGEYATVKTALLIAFIAGVASAVIIAIWVVPMHMILEKYNFFRLSCYVALSVVASLAFSVFYGMWAEIKFDIALYASCLVVGVLSSIVFWYIAVCKKHK